MNEPVRQEQEPDLDNALLSGRDETAPADSPIELLKGFLGLSLLVGGAEALSGAAMNVVGGMEGGLSGLASEVQIAGPTNALDLGNTPGAFAIPSTPSFTA